MTEVPARRLKWRQNYLDVSGVFFFPMNKDIVRVMVESRATRPTRIGVNLLYSTNISMPTQAAVAARVIKRVRCLESS